MANHAQGRGTGWIDQPEDAAVIAALVEKIKAQQATIAASSKTHLDGRIDRGQHQKQTLGAFGTLSLFDTIPAELKQNSFTDEGAIAYRIACRFSNGQPCPFSDKAADVRGVAIKFFTRQGMETDLLMTNEGGRSHARNAVQFMDFADILVAQIANGAGDALETASKEVFTGKLNPVELARIVAILAKETKFHSVESLATERFWGSVVKLGAVAMKYSLQPHESTKTGTFGDRQRDDYLREDLLNRLNEAPLKWQLCAQFFVDEASTPVNDASVTWAGTPIAIGTVEIASRPSADDEAVINQMAFNPANGFEPLGITHARKSVYAASAENRKDRGLLSGEEARKHLQPD